ncbi:MAG: GTP cyclohydrolase II [Acidobacteriota bacterium]
MHLNFAVAADGRMAAVNGSSLQISSAGDWARVHRLREGAGAVAVGGRTWRRDRPRLTARSSRLGRQPLRQPDRVVFGGRGSESFRPAPEPIPRRTFLIGSRAPQVEGVAFVFARDRDLRSPLETLLRHGVGSLLVEGGPTLLRSFLDQSCFDRITAFVDTDDPAAARRALWGALPVLPPMAVEPLAEGILLSSGPGRGAPASGPGPVPAAKARLPTSVGDFTAWAFEDPATGAEHFALVLGDLRCGPPPLVRIHSECLTGDVLGSLRCDCGPQLQLAVRRIVEEGCGVLLYLQQEGRGIGLVNKIRAYALQERGYDTVEANEHLGFPADLRDYSFAAAMLADLGVGDLRLMTNNPAKLEALGRHGLRVVERMPLAIPPGADNAAYLATKRRKLRHLPGR